jgi:hypothetical protein
MVLCVRGQIMGSEVGVVDVPHWDIASKGRLMPGNIFLVDFEAGRVIKDEEVCMRAHAPPLTCVQPVWPKLCPHSWAMRSHQQYVCGKSCFEGWRKVLSAGKERGMVQTRDGIVSICCVIPCARS